MTLTINGANDQIADVDAGTDLSGGVTEQSAAVPLATTITAGGTFDIRDADLTQNNVLATRTGGTVAAGHEGGLVASVSAGPNGTGLQTVTWTYTTDHGKLDYLGAGDTATDVFRVRVLDQVSGGFRDHTVTITLTGTNDAPVLGVITSPAAVAEVTGNSAAQDIAAITGTLTVSDVDIGGAAADVLTASTTGVVAALNGNSTTFTLPSGAQSLITSALTFGSSVTATGADQTIGWTYNPAAANLDFLKAGDTLTLTYTVKVTDNSSVTETQDSNTRDIVITITGTNDVPVITGEASGDHAVTEETDVAATGTVSIVDLDRGESTFTAVAVAAASASGYGTYTLTSAGVWAYSLNNANATVQALSAGETLSDSFTVVSSDGTASKTVSITITGTNDVPVITVEATGDHAVTEETDLAASGTLSITDTDDGEATFTAVAVAAASASGYGTYTLTAAGVWAYELNNANGMVQALSAGETLADSFTVVSSDGTASKTVSITITGTNDVPVITGEATGDHAVTEETDLAASGTVSITDTDDGEATFTAVAVAAASASGYGTYTLTAAGEWAYALNAANARGAGVGWRNAFR
ncbi:MAG: hypothetical protein HOP09_14140 [Hyphomicrobium sp.]|nr:hypothetical protein [Hyphomicrobium sp.]